MIEPRAKVVGTGNLTVFYVSTPIGTELTTVADVLSALREVTQEMFDAGATEIYGATREQAKEYAKTEKFESAGREARRTFLAMLDQFEKDNQESAT